MNRYLVRKAATEAGQLSHFHVETSWLADCSFLQFGMLRKARKDLPLQMQSHKKLRNLAKTGPSPKVCHH